MGISMQGDQGPPRLLVTTEHCTPFGLICHGSTLVHASVRRRFSSVRLLATPWTIAHQAPQPVAFSRQEYWSGLPGPPPGDLPNPGIEPASLTSPALPGGFFSTGPPGKPFYPLLGKKLYNRP